MICSHNVNDSFLEIAQDEEGNGAPTCQSVHVLSAVCEQMFYALNFLVDCPLTDVAPLTYDSSSHKIALAIVISGTGTLPASGLAGRQPQNIFC